MMDAINCDCLEGTFSAMPWHTGRHVSADPSGFNWRIVDHDVDIALHGLNNYGQTVFWGERMRVQMDNLPEFVAIHAYDTAIPEHAGCHAVLSPKGREQFKTVLEQVVGRTVKEP